MKGQSVAVLGRQDALADYLEAAGLSVVAQVRKMEALPGILRWANINALVLEDPDTGGWDPGDLASHLEQSTRVVGVVVLDRGADPKKTDRALSSSLGTLETCRWLGLYQTIEEVIRALVEAESLETPGSTISGPHSEQFQNARCRRHSVQGEWIHPRHWLDNIPQDTRPSAHAPEVFIPHEMIAVYSPKGGVGKTFVASNLSVALSRLLPGRVALLDLDFRCADVCLHLDLLNGPTFIDLLPYATDLTPEVMGKYMVRHRNSGLDVLLGPSQPELADLVGTEHVSFVLRAAEKRYSHVIIDMPPENGSDLVNECLRSASRVILVTTQETAAMRHARIAVESIERLGLSPDRILLVVNRVEPASSLTVQQVEAFLGMTAAVTIEENRKAVEESVFQGRPLVDMSRPENLAASLASLAYHFCPIGEKTIHSIPSPRSSRFTWPWRRRS